MSRCILVHRWGLSQQYGYVFGGPHSKDHNMLGSILGARYLRKLTCICICIYIYIYTCVSKKLLSGAKMYSAMLTPQYVASTWHKVHSEASYN